MEAIGAAANIIAVIDLSAKVATLCLQYYTEVAGAQADITRLQSQINHQLEDKLDPSRARKAMRRFGLRALKWPFSRKEMESVIANLERCEQTIMVDLQVDQTRILLDINDKIEGISPQVADDSPKVHKPHFMVPFPADPDFFERPAIWTWLTERYAEPVSRIALEIQIAIQFAYHVYGSTKARFEESYRSIADALALPRRRDPGVNVLTLVRDWLQRDDVSPWLMSLDNADALDMFFSKDEGEDDTQVLIASCLPKTHNGKTLVTSRSLTVSEKLTGSHKAILRIPTMGRSEALELFRNKFDGDIDEAAAADLVSTLDFIPLAVNQSAAYINRRAPRLSIRSYLVDFQKSQEKRGSLLHSDAGDLRRHEDVSNAVVVTWQVTFEQIRRQQPAAANFLSLMSLFEAQNIPEYMLHGYSNVDSDCGESDFEDDLDVLRGYSLVNTTTKGFCEMHSLVKLCTQVWISSLASKHFPSGDFETWEQCQTLLPHLQSILKEEPVEESDWLDWSTLLANTSWYMILAQNALRMRTRILGEGDTDTLASMWKEAEELKVKVLGISSRVQGEEDSSTLVSMLREAEELQAKQLGICLRVLGKDHVSNLGRLNEAEDMDNLASTYRVQGRLREAEEPGSRAVELQKRVLGEEHPETLTSMANLAFTYRLQGRWGEAEELQIMELGITSRVLGEEHVSTLGRMKEAEALKLQSMESLKRVLGDEHPDMVNSMANVAYGWHRLGRRGDVITLIKNCTQKSISTLRSWQESFAPV
ncbi:hypothetical protein BGZ61DRAFT_490401 [Ilyonectria robusta]|uniref:uncharacterized protein n=1 Tax=Ilyonectria robusta TaxID=1079257 RepID=UPI001E8EBB2A|nr:uncharacterized protein BGZ61DRAFT_490401 [Ilyonectria robusta]KAH8734444.1 hypothetical protein BGZ61DRAFT_490401 [Ilyonectria robusta]